MTKYSQVSLVIPGEPIPKARARTLKAGYSFTPKTTVEYRELIQSCWLAEHLVEEITHPIQMAIKFFLGAPKYLQKKNPTGISLELLPAAGRKDVDNMAKAIMDALEGLAYKNDSQIYSLLVVKYYSDNPRAEVMISWNKS